MGAVAPAIGSGTLESWKSVQLFESEVMQNGLEIAKKVAGAYDSPV